jgi:predicted Zn-dependent protease
MAGTPLAPSDTVRIPRFLIVFATLAIAGCEISQDDEAALGAQNADEINSQVELVGDGVINNYLSALGDSIASHTERNDLEWHFFIVNSHQVNAFSLPGGFVYVNRGLIEQTQRLDELAGVLGHEIGHVIQRHSVKQMQSSQKVGVVTMIACTLTNLCNTGLGQVAINVGGSAVIARHSRQDEFQADSEAVENVLRVGIDPEGIPSLFQSLIDQRKSEPTVLDSWFATHPLEESRIEHAKELIDRTGAEEKGGLLQDTPAYQAFRQRVIALPEPQVRTR